MKILIVNTSDIQGGAARAAYRLHKSLLSKGVDSQMLVQNKSGDDWTVMGPDSKVQKGMGEIRPTLDGIPIKFYKNKTKTLFSPSWLPFGGIVNKINKINPDIVHLHWVCGGMMTIEDIAKIKAPIVWSLHDMWAFTDGYHYDETYDICKNGCQSESNFFLSNRVFKRKQKTYTKKDDMTIVGLSNWLNECSKNSELLKDKKHINLPNPIDTNIFKPFDKKKARELWGLSHDKKLILFGAMDAASNPRKGFKELSGALRKLEKNNNIELIVFGSNKPEKSLNFGFKIHYLGVLSDDVSLVSLYSAADVMIVPSVQENLSNAIMESLSCSTPVVGFDVGGNSDMIDHKSNGYLAKPFDVVGLKCGIEWVLSNAQYDKVCLNAREKVLTKFNSTLVARKYMDLYESILNKEKF
jgi:glycosyltransferase involved in cell wall biosynthesis